MLVLWVAEENLCQLRFAFSKLLGYRLGKLTCSSHLKQVGSLDSNYGLPAAKFSAAKFSAAKLSAAKFSAALRYPRYDRAEGAEQTLPE